MSKHVSDVTEWFENQRDEFHNGLPDSDAKFDQLDEVWTEVVESKCHLFDITDRIDVDDITKLLEITLKARHACIVDGEVTLIFPGTEQQLANLVAEAFRQGRKL